jgi:hypothetical protein
MIDFISSLAILELSRGRGGEEPTMMTDEQIARYEDAGFSRWTKRDMDRLYIDTTRLGLECDLKRDHEPCLGDWQGKRVSEADCRRIYFSKVWVDVRDGSLHVASDFQPSLGDESVEDAARAYIATI